MIRAMLLEANNTTSANDQYEQRQGMPPFLHETTRGRVIIAFLALEALLILAANSLVFVLFKQKRFLRTKTNLVLVSLAASDFLAGAVSLPLVLTCSCTGSWPVCLSMDLCQRFLSISTILHLVVATGERYFKIVYPFKYQWHATRLRIVQILLAVWLFSCGASVVQLTWTDLTGLNETPEQDLAYSATCLVVLVSAPFVTIIGVDARIFHCIRKAKQLRSEIRVSRATGTRGNRTRGEDEKERKVVVTYVLMTASFALGWFPYFLVTLLTDLRVIRGLPLALSVVLLFMKSGTALVNPLLYTFLKADFRKAMKTFSDVLTSIEGVTAPYELGRLS